MQFLLVFQSLILPVALSYLFLLLDVQSARWRAASLVLIWLVVYLWVRGWPSLPPAETLDWIWISILLLWLSTFIRPLVWWRAANVFVVIVSVLVYAWAVVIDQFTVSLGVELMFAGLIGVIIFYRTQQQELQNPALIMCFSAAGMAIVVVLEGSLLLGQLSAALSASMGIFALNELIARKKRPRLNFLQLNLMLAIYIALLVIGRVYAEIPLFPSALLAVSPLFIGLIGWRYNWLVSALLIVFAVSVTLLQSDQGVYY
ncbi:MAG: hypothetical protein GXP13_01095 [Gammaproteobacteria bacterium]|nr:hypothetical protein [Gammaproteobacteria bacterium]